MKSQTICLTNGCNSVMLSVNASIEIAQGSKNGFIKLTCDNSNCRGISYFEKNKFIEGLNPIFGKPSTSKLLCEHSTCNAELVSIGASSIKPVQEKGIFELTCNNHDKHENDVTLSISASIITNMVLPKAPH